MHFHSSSSEGLDSSSHLRSTSVEPTVKSIQHFGSSNLPELTIRSDIGGADLSRLTTNSAAYPQTSFSRRHQRHTFPQAALSTANHPSLSSADSDINGASIAISIPDRKKTVKQCHCSLPPWLLHPSQRSSTLNWKCHYGRYSFRPHKHVKFSNLCEGLDDNPIIFFYQLFDELFQRLLDGLYFHYKTIFHELLILMGVALVFGSYTYWIYSFFMSWTYDNPHWMQLQVANKKNLNPNYIPTPREQHFLDLPDPFLNNHFF